MHVSELLSKKGWLHSQPEDWIVVVCPDCPELWVHKPFIQQVKVPIQVIAGLALQLLDSIPAGQNHGELVGTVPPQKREIDGELVEIKTPFQYNLAVLARKRYCVYGTPPPEQLRVTPFFGE